MRALVLAPLALAVALSGCTTDGMHVQVTNATATVAVVHVWINHSAETPWHHVETIGPHAGVSFGVYHAKTHDDYTMTAVSGARRISHPGAIDQSYRRWSITVGPDDLTESLSVE
jgi:hypothetical protein